MARYSNRVKFRKRITPWEVGSTHVLRGGYLDLSERELIFALLVWCGMPRANAFAFVFSESKASEHSLPLLAGRMVNNYRFRQLFCDLAQYATTLQFKFPKDIDKTNEKIRLFYDQEK